MVVMLMEDQSNIIDGDIWLKFEFPLDYWDFNENGKFEFGIQTRLEGEPFIDVVKDGEQFFIVDGMDNMKKFLRRWRDNKSITYTFVNYYSSSGEEDYFEEHTRELTEYELDTIRNLFGLISFYEEYGFWVGG
jgi:hypothetical protein